jgi:hypothetical protein
LIAKSSPAKTSFAQVLGWWNGAPTPPFRLTAIQPCIGGGTKHLVSDLAELRFVHGKAIDLPLQICSKTASGNRCKRTCDKASPTAAVMLHLRSCYVSKAAILTVPVPLVPVENRSPA